MAIRGIELEAFPMPEKIESPDGGVFVDIAFLNRGLNGEVWQAKVQKAPEGGKIRAGEICAVKVSANLTPEKRADLTREGKLLGKEGSLISQFETNNQMFSIIEIAPGMDLREAIYNTTELDGKTELKSAAGKPVMTKKKLKDPPGISMAEKLNIRIELTANKGLDGNDQIILNKIIKGEEVSQKEELKLLEKISMDDILLIQGKITREDKLSPEEKNNIALGLLRGQYVLQQHRLVHCDQKPDNIQFDPTSSTVKILDLGNAIDLDEAYRHPDFQSAGFYVGPEAERMYSLDRVNSIQTDECSLGMVIASLYSSKSFEQEMAMSPTGETLNPREIMSDVLGPGVTHVEGMDDNLLQAVCHLTEANPLDRPESIGQARGLIRMSELADMKKVRANFASDLGGVKSTLESIVANLPEKERKAHSETEKKYQKVRYFSKKIRPLLDDLDNLRREYDSITAHIQKARRLNQDPSVLVEEQARRLNDFNEKLRVLSRFKEIPDEAKTLLAGAAQQKGSMREKLSSIVDGTKKILDENPKLPLQAVGDHQDLATIYHKIHQYQSAHPENAELNRHLDSVLQGIEQKCARNARELQQDRTKKLNAYPRAVMTLGEDLRTLAGKHRATIGPIILREAARIKELPDHPNVRSQDLEGILNDLKGKLAKSSVDPAVISKIGEIEQDFNAVKNRAPDFSERNQRSNATISAAAVPADEAPLLSAAVASYVEPDEVKNLAAIEALYQADLDEAKFRAGAADSAAAAAPESEASDESPLLAAAAASPAVEPSAAASPLDKFSSEVERRRRPSTPRASNASTIRRVSEGGAGELLRTNVKDLMGQTKKEEMEVRRQSVNLGRSRVVSSSAQARPNSPLPLLNQYSASTRPDSARASQSGSPSAAAAPETPPKENKEGSGFKNK